MYSKAFLLGIGFCVSKAAFSGTMGPVIESYNGVYVGGDIGVSNLIDKESTLYSPGLYDRHQFSATGFVGGGILGYDYSISDRIKLGIEGFINGTALNIAAEQKYSPWPSFKANMRYDAGIRLLPGYEFSPGTIGHILLGYAHGNMNIKDDGNYGYIDRGINSNGFQAGLGINVPCYFKNLSLRGDMIYTRYVSNTSLGLTTSFTPLNYYNRFASIEGNLSLIYKFL